MADLIRADYRALTTMAGVFDDEAQRAALLLERVTIRLRWLIVACLSSVLVNGPSAAHGDGMMVMMQAQPFVAPPTELPRLELPDDLNLTGTLAYGYAGLLVLVDLESGDRVQYDSGPAIWNPHFHPELPLVVAGEWGVYLLDVDTSNITLLTPSLEGFGRDASHPRFSPDGRAVLYDEYWYAPEEPYNGERLVLFDLASQTRQVVQIQDALGAAEAVWSPDAEDILIRTTLDLGNDKFSLGYHTISSACVQGGMVCQAERLPLLEGRSVQAARWGGDPRYIAYLRLISDTRRKALYIVDLQTGEQQQLTTSDTNVSHFAWSPNGNGFMLTVRVNEGANSHLYYLDRATRELTFVSDYGAGAMDWTARTVMPPLAE